MTYCITFENLLSLYNVGKALKSSHHQQYINQYNSILNNKRIRVTMGKILGKRYNYKIYTNRRMFTIMSAIPPAFSMFYALTFYERLRLFLVILKYLYLIWASRELVVAFFPLLTVNMYCSPTSEMTEWSAEVSVAPLSTCSTNRSWTWKLLFHFPPDSHLHGDGMESVETQIHQCQN